MAPTREQSIEMAHDLAMAAAALVYIAFDNRRWDHFMAEGQRAADFQGVAFRPHLLTRDHAKASAQHLLSIAENVMTQLGEDPR